MLAISDLTESDVQQAEDLLVQVLKDEFPSMDLSRGRVLRELLVRPAAIFHALNDEDMDRLRRSFSIQQIAADPTLANDDIVDGVMSNLLIDRDDGANAAGQVRLIIEQNVTTPIDAGSVFTANELNFRTTRAFVGVTSSTSAIGDGSRLITSRSDGYYEFLVDVQAESPGTAYNVASGQRFTVSPAIPRLIDAQAAIDFSGGRVSEDNAALVDRVQDGLSPRTMAGRSHIEALLQSQFPNLFDLSIIGFGDAEMRRDSHNLFAVGTGGKVDIYARMATAPERVIVTATATMQDSVSRRLNVILDRDAAAGVYDVLAVYAAGVTPYQLDDELEPSLVDSLEITARTWSFNATQTGDEFVPDLFTAEEAAFTRYRTLNLEFIDPSSTLTNGGTASYQIFLLKMPDIAAAQDFVNDRSRRGPATDYLVKAPIPAMCSIGVEVAARVTGEVNVSAIRNAIAERINALGFSVGHLPASVIVDAAQGQLPSDAVVDMPIQMLATLYLPDGSRRTLNGTDELRVPETGNSSVSARTVGWFVRTASIDVSVQEILTPRV